MQMQCQALAGSTQVVATKKGEQQKARLKVMDIEPEAAGCDVYWVDFWGEEALSDEELRQQVAIDVRRVSASPGKQQPGAQGARAFLNISGGAVRLNGQVVQQEVARKITAIRHDRDAGLPITSEKRTVGAYLESWIEMSRPAYARGRTRITHGIFANTSSRRWGRSSCRSSAPSTCSVCSRLRHRRDSPRAPSARSTACCITRSVKPSRWASFPATSPRW
jgi:hypothetical protein